MEKFISLQFTEWKKWNAWSGWGVKCNVNKASNVTNCKASVGWGSCSEGVIVPVWRIA